MRSHLNAAAMKYGGEFSNSHDGTNRLTKEEGRALVDDYSIIFREQFCVAASELADQIHEPLDRIGVLFDEIMSTGMVAQQMGPRTKKSLFKRYSISNNSSVDIEHGGRHSPIMFGRGQLLFVVRRTNKSETARLQSAGYRFANTQNVVDILARSMQVSSEELSVYLDKMRLYANVNASGSTMLEPGIYLACFAVRASVGGTFDVLVRKDAKNQLPTCRLPIASLGPLHTEFLSHIHGFTVAQCVNWLKSQISSQSQSDFTLQFYDTLVELVATVNDPFFQDATLVTSPFTVPCRGVGESKLPGEAIIIAFNTIVSIHTQNQSEGLEFSPLSFFKVRQQVYRNAPDHNVFARQIHREFAPILSDATKDTMLMLPKNVPQSSHAGSRTSLSARSPSPYPFVPNPNPKSVEKRDRRYFWQDRVSSSQLPRPDNSSEKSLVNQKSASTAASQSWGGIMVSQEVSVDVKEFDGKLDAHHNRTDSVEKLGETGVEMSDMSLGTSGVATRETDDPITFVDKLFELCVKDHR
jgi:hypothetical protein